LPDQTANRAAAWARAGAALLGAALLGLGLAAAAPAAVFDRIVAIVNDDIITLSELEEAARPVLDRLVRSQPSGAALEKQVYEAKAQILRMLVDQKLAEQEISRLGIAVSREDVDRVIEDVKREGKMTDEELRAALGEEGIGWEEYRKQVSDQLCRARLINEEVRGKIVITSERCRAYYDQHLSEYRTYDEAQVDQILLAVPAQAPAEERERQSRKAGEALAMLKAEADFATLAKQYSEAPTAADGGSLGWLRLDQLAPNLKEVLSHLKPGEMSEVVATAQGFQIFRVRESRQGGLKPFEEAKDEINRKLFQQEVDREYERWLTGLRQKAYIKITF
jgi:peptidyl-prolyl cis-trans isomerase SurA